MGGDEPGRAEEHGGVAVMAAGVHDAGILRGEGSAALFFEGQRVDIRPEDDGGAAFVSHDGDESLVVREAADLVSEGRELFRDAGGSRFFMKRELAVSVEMAAHIRHVGGERFRFISEIHKYFLSEHDNEDGAAVLRDLQVDVSARAERQVEDDPQGEHEDPRDGEGYGIGQHIGDDGAEARVFFVHLHIAQHEGEVGEERREGIRDGVADAVGHLGERRVVAEEHHHGHHDRREDRPFRRRRADEDIHDARHDDEADCP